MKQIRSAIFGLRFDWSNTFQNRRLAMTGRYSTHHNLRNYFLIELCSGFSLRVDIPQVTDFYEIVCLHLYDKRIRKFF